MLLIHILVSESIGVYVGGCGHFSIVNEIKTEFIHSPDLPTHIWYRTDRILFKLYMRWLLLMLLDYIEEPLDFLEIKSIRHSPKLENHCILIREENKASTEKINFKLYEGVWLRLKKFSKELLTKFEITFQKLNHRISEGKVRWWTSSVLSNHNGIIRGMDCIIWSL